MVDEDTPIQLIGDALIRGGTDYSRLLNVNVSIAIVLGEKKVPLREIAKIGVGSIVELDRMVGEPVELHVNDEPLASGEIVAVEGHYGLRILSIYGLEDEDDDDFPPAEEEEPVTPPPFGSLGQAAFVE